MATKGYERATYVSSRNEEASHKLTVKVDDFHVSIKPTNAIPNIAISKGIAGKLNHKNDTGKNQNKIQYKNKHLWSKLSVELENMMKPLIVQMPELIPNYDALSSMMNGYEIGIVDSIVSVDLPETVIEPVAPVEPQYDPMTGELIEADNASADSLTGMKIPKRDHVDRYFCHWSYFAEQFMFSKDKCEKSQIGPTVLTLVNDFITEQIEAEQAQNSPKPTGFHYPNKAELEKVMPKSDGDFPCSCLLKAVTAEGNVHVRPLCTSSDVIVAIYELLDPRIIKSGVIQMPHVYSNVFKRHTDGFYRYIYRINRPPEWQYMKINLPSDLTELSPFICPTLYDIHLIMETTSVYDTAKVPKRLLAVSEQITRYMTEHYSAERMMTHMCVDFEALYKPGAAVPAPPTGVMGGGSVATGTTFISKGSSISSSVAGTSVDSKNFMAKHAKTSDGMLISEHEFRFRILQISNLEFTDRHAIHRRFALPRGIPKDKLEYLKYFNFFFKQEWKNLERREKLMKQQRHFVELKKMSNLTTHLVERRRMAIHHDDINLQLLAHETEHNLGERLHHSSTNAGPGQHHRHSYIGVLSGVHFPVEQTVPYNTKDDTNPCYVNAIGYAREQFENFLIKQSSKKPDDSSDDDEQVPENPFEAAENSVFQFAGRENRMGELLLVSDLLASGKVATPEDAGPLKPPTPGRTTTIRRRANVKTGRSLELKRQQTEREKNLKKELDIIEARNKELLDKYRHLMYIEEEVAVQRKESVQIGAAGGARATMKHTDSAKPGPAVPRATRSKSIRNVTTPGSTDGPTSPKVGSPGKKKNAKLNNNKSVEETHTKLIEIARLEFLNEYLSQINQRTPPTSNVSALFDHNGMRHHHDEDQVGRYRKNYFATLKLLTQTPVDPAPPLTEGIHLEVPEEYALEDYIYRMTTIDEEDEEQLAEEAKGIHPSPLLDSPTGQTIVSQYRKLDGTVPHQIRHQTKQGGHAALKSTAEMSFNYIKEFHDGLGNVNSRINRRKAAHKLLDQHNQMIKELEAATEDEVAERLEFQRLMSGSRRQTPVDRGSPTNFSVSSRDSGASPISPSPLARSGAVSPVHMTAAPQRSTVDGAPVVVRPRPKAATKLRNHLTVVQDINKSLAGMAFKLAEKMDTSYLFSKFDINNHVNRENEIVSMELVKEPLSPQKSAQIQLFRENRRESSDVKRLHQEFHELVDFKHQHQEESQPTHRVSGIAAPEVPPMTLKEEDIPDDLITHTVNFNDYVDDGNDEKPVIDDDEFESPPLAESPVNVEEAPAESFLEAQHDLKLKYEQESDRMMDLLLAGLAPDLAKKIRQGMINKARADAYKKRMLYIMRRREREKISKGAVAILKEFYEYNKLMNNKFGEMSDSSSEEEEEEEAVVEQVENLLGDYNMSEEAINALILQRIQEDLERQMEEERQKQLELERYEKMRLAREAAGRRQAQLEKKSMGVLVTDALDRRLSVAKKRISMCPEVYAALQANEKLTDDSAKTNFKRMSMDQWKQAMVNFQPPARPITADSTTSTEGTSTRNTSRAQTADHSQIPFDDELPDRPDTVGGLLWGDSPLLTAEGNAGGSLPASAGGLKSASSVHSTHSRIPSAPPSRAASARVRTPGVIDEELAEPPLDEPERPPEEIVEDFSAVCSNINRLIEELNLMHSLENMREQKTLVEPPIVEPGSPLLLHNIKPPKSVDPLVFANRKEHVKMTYNKFLSQHNGTNLIGDNFQPPKVSMQHVKVSRPIPFRTNGNPVPPIKSSTPLVKSPVRPKMPVIGQHIQGEVGLLHKLPSDFFRTGSLQVSPQKVVGGDGAAPKRLDVFNDILLSREIQAELAGRVSLNSSVDMSAVVERAPSGIQAGTTSRMVNTNMQLDLTTVGSADVISPTNHDSPNNRTNLKKSLYNGYPLIMTDDTPQSSRGPSRAQSRSRGSPSVQRTDSVFIDEEIQTGVLMFDDSASLTMHSGDDASLNPVQQAPQQPVKPGSPSRRLGLVTPVEGMRSIVEDEAEDGRPLPDEFVGDHSIVSWVSENSAVLPTVVRSSAAPTLGEGESLKQEYQRLHPLAGLGGSKWTPFFIEESVPSPPLESPVLVPRHDNAILKGKAGFGSPLKPKGLAASMKSPRVNKIHYKGN